jgi:hypothetical protein
MSQRSKVTSNFEVTVTGGVPLPARLVKIAHRAAADANAAIGRIAQEKPYTTAFMDLLRRVTRTGTDFA